MFEVGGIMRSLFDNDSKEAVAQPHPVIAIYQDHIKPEWRGGFRTGALKKTHRFVKPFMLDIKVGKVEPVNILYIEAPKAYISNVAGKEPSCL